MEKKTTKVVIVDDDPFVYNIFKTILRRKQVDMISIQSLHEASDYLLTHEPDYIFLDNNLPDGLGIEYVNKFKNEHPNVTLSMITAEGSLELKNLALTRGADYFIHKPFTVSAIRNIVN